MWNNPKGNVIISPTSMPLIKTLLQNVSHLHQGTVNWFSKQDMDVFKLDMELILPLLGVQFKTYFKFCHWQVFDQNNLLQKVFLVDKYQPYSPVVRLVIIFLYSQYKCNAVVSAGHHFLQTFHFCLLGETIRADGRFFSATIFFCSRMWFC